MGLLSSLLGRKPSPAYREAVAHRDTSSHRETTPHREAVSRRKAVANVLILVDLSSSMGAEALNYLSDKGLRCVLDILRKHSLSTDIVYRVAVFGFSSRTQEIIPFEDAIALANRTSLPRLEMGSVTCMEEALWECFARIDQLKSQQDASRTPRAGSLLVAITDGRPTDDMGHPKALSPELATEIRHRNETRQTNTFAIGMGQVDDETLLQIGPNVSEEWVDGQRYETPRAVRYLDADYHGSECWEAVCSLIGQASSSSTGKPFVVDAESQAEHLPDYAEVIVLDSSRFRVVK